jgi:dTDP-4-dehydrorhamnose reductase
MKVVITGAAGMLARDLVNALAPRYELFLVDRIASSLGKEHEFACIDLVDDRGAIPAIRDSGASLVFHCAAYTDVDGAEEHVDEAYRGNALAAARVCAACREAGIPLVAISTDYVFDGTKKGAYCEFDQPNPLSVYGKSKLWGEQLALQSGARAAIVRTSWLFGAGGRNFVKTIMHLAGQRDSISVVDDQRGSPTYTLDLAQSLATLAEGLLSGRPFEGIWHLSNSGVCTWYEFAEAIVSLAGLAARVEPISTDALGRPAQRPRNSALQDLRWRLEGLPPRRHWRAALEAYLAEERAAGE